MRLYILLCIIFLPLSVEAFSVTEIMYDVSGTDTKHEWIEVYNDSDSDIDITDWVFSEGGTNHILTPQSTGVIAKNGYAVIADNATVFQSDYPLFQGVLFDSSFSLSNTGEELSIKDGEGNVMDSLTYDVSIGANGDGLSLQRIGTIWGAYAPTPGSDVSSSTESLVTENATTTPPSADSFTAHDGGGGVSTFVKTVPFAVSVGENRIIAAGTPVTLTASAREGYSPRYAWSFGDGATAEGKEVSHVYYYPGTYALVLRGNVGADTSVSRATITVFDPKIEIADVTADYITLANASKYELNLYNWKLLHGDMQFVFPKDTILYAGSTVRFPNQITKLTTDSHVYTVLVTPLIVTKSIFEPVALFGPTDTCPFNEWELAVIENIERLKALVAPTCF